MKNKKDRIKLEVLSRIDDDVIEKATKKRIALLSGVRRALRKKIITWTALAASLVILFTGAFWVVTLMTRQAPIYTGMTVSNQPAVQQGVRGWKNASIIPLAAGGQEGNSGNHYGHENNKEVDQETPFTGEGTSTAAPVEDAAKDSLQVVGGVKDIYYAKPNEDIYITIHFDNPDEFEIVSFTLNGNKYTNYMFEYGSDLENIILKVNVGDVTGIVEYTIDAIKYIRGTQIEDVRMEGDQTVRVGIATTQQPKAEITNEVIGFNDGSFDVQVSDMLGLIAKTPNSKLAVVLYDGETILGTQEIPVDEKKTVKFENLKTNTLYQYAIVAYYDALDGTGTNVYTIYKKALYTKAIVTFEQINVGNEGLTFGFLWDEDFSARTIKSLSLYRNNVKVMDLDATGTAVTGLLSNTEYTLLAEYDNNGATESISVNFTTVAKTVPTVAVTEKEKTQTSLNFDVAVTDADSICNITKIELYKGEELIKTAENLDVRSFDGLTSATQHTVKVTYTYDLNDGNGVQEASVEENIITRVSVSISDIQILADQSVKPNTDVSLIVDVQNPSEVTVTELKINGVWIEAKQVFNSTTSYQLTSGLPVESGRATFACTGVRYEFLGEAIEQETSYTDADSILVLGQISVVSERVSKFSYQVGEEVTVTVEFAGSEAYDLESAKISRSGGAIVLGLTKINETTYSYSFQQAEYSGVCNLRITEVVYQYAGEEFTQAIGETSTLPYTGYYVSASPIIDISTPDQLQHMENGKSYRLVSDIDLAGYDWQPYSFQGALDGNGYSILNFKLERMTAGREFPRAEDGGLGMFTAFNGVLRNVVLKNCDVKIHFYSGHDYVGILAGIGNGVVEDCRIEGDIWISTAENNHIVDPGGYFGIVGRNDDNWLYLNRCVYYGQLITNGSPSEFNPFIGYSGRSISGRVVISNSVSYSNLKDITFDEAMHWEYDTKHYPYEDYPTDET